MRSKLPVTRPQPVKLVTSAKLRHIAGVVLLILQFAVIAGCKHSATPASVTAPTVDEATTKSVDSANAQQPESENADESQPTAREVGVAENSLPGTPIEPTDPANLTGLTPIPTGLTPIPPGDWTKQRLIALTPKGPLILDLMLRVGGQDLDAANAAAIKPVQVSLLGELGEKSTWEALLELPLIESGWLGNLRAEAGQTPQLIGLYDKNKDGLVQAGELTEFLTRGLARSQPVSIADAGSEPNPDSNSSPFGILDTDLDNVLSAQELQQGSTVLAKLDFNGDTSISLSEIAPTASANSMASAPMSRSMLKTSSLIFHQLFHQPASDDEQKYDRKQLQRKVTDVLEYYSFLGSIERQQWPGWSDAQWKLADKNADSQLNKLELAAIFEMEPFVQIAIDLPSPDQDQQQLAWYCHSTTPGCSWSSGNSSAQLRHPLCNILVTMDDLFSASTKTQLRNRLSEALKNSQFKQFFLQQLQLKENALEIVDADGDLLISDAEFDNVWRWFTIRQAARVQARWMIAARPWFQLLDMDRNQSISEVELSRLAEVFSKADANHDGVIDVSELPMMVRFQLARQDQRMDLRAFPPTQTASSGGSDDGSWFSAMDTNRDGSIAKQEFLGTNSEFQALDRDGDGFISQSEVY